MNETKTLIEDNSLEETLLKPLDNHKNEKLTEDESKVYIGLVFMLKDKIDEAYEDMAKQAWAIKVWEARTEGALTVKITKRVLMFIAIRVLGNVGMGVMYIYYLQYWAKVNDVKEITIDLLFSHVFPMGFFPKEEMHKLWDAQKVVGYGYTDNIIDIPKSAKSIMF